MRRALFAVTATLFAREDGPPPADRVAWAVDEAHDFFAHAGARARLTFRALLLAVSILAPLAIWRLPPFRRLDHASRVAALERLERSKLGMVVLGLKLMLCLFWYEHPDTLREIEADTKCLLPVIPTHHAHEHEHEAAE
jgi:hypothetical protein